MSTIPMEHVWLDERGVAWVDDTNIKVLEIALDQVAHGLTAEEIYTQHERRLNLGQIYAALACYYDHQADFDREIEQQLHQYEQRREQSLNSPVRHRLRAQGKLP